MGFLIYWTVLGALAGYVGKRVLKLDLGLPQTIALGIVGALLGGLALRLLLAVLGAAAGFIGALLGVAMLVYGYKCLTNKRK